MRRRDDRKRGLGADDAEPKLTSDNFTAPEVAPSSPEIKTAAPATVDIALATDPTASNGANRLPILAAEIRRAHADVQDAARTAAQRAIDAGHALIEAKELVPHGQWLPWLREHCALAERTGQLYMKIARSGLESATVADLGLQGAAELLVFYIDYWSDLTPADLVEWRVFALFLARKCGFHIEGALAHTEWLRRGQVGTPSEWLFGENGQRFRRNWCGSDLPQVTLDLWRDFLAANRERTQSDLEAEIQRVSIEHGEPRVPPPLSKQARRRLLRPDRKFTAALRKATRGCA